MNEIPRIIDQLEREQPDIERDGSVDVGDEVAHGRHQRYDP